MNYDKDWYNKLKKSPLNPPPYVFGIVWPILYCLLGISFYLVWTNKKCFPFCNELIFFLIQLFLNLTWSTIFFKLKKFKISLISLGTIILMTFITYHEFMKINKFSAYLLTPYIMVMFRFLFKLLYSN